MPIKEDSQSTLDVLSAIAGGTGRKHPVPQNVMDVEFKVVGDLSLRQVAYAFAGVGVAYLFFKSGLPNFWAYSLAIFSLVAGAAIAFVPYEERTLDKWLVLFIRGMFRPTQMIWRKDEYSPAYFLADYADIIKNEIITLTPTKSRNKLDDYLGRLPDDPDNMDIYSKDRVQDIFLQVENLNIGAEVVTNDNLISMRAKEDEPKLKFPDIHTTKPVVTANQASEIQTPAQTLPTTPTETAPPISPKEPQLVVQDKIDNQTRNAPSSEPYVPPNKNEIVNAEIETKKELVEALNTNYVEVVSSDHIDRPIKNWPTELDSQIKGEFKIKTSTKLPPTIVAQDIKVIKEQEESLEKKVHELLEVADRAKKEFQGKGFQIDNNSRMEFYKNKYHELKQEKETLTTEISKNTSRVNMLEGHKQKEPLEKQVNELTDRNKELEEKLMQIQEQLFNLQKKPEEKPVIKEPEPPKDRVLNTSDSENINIISGTVKGKSGDLIENAVVLIKDLQGNVSRALKTNKLGQFKTQTPMPNGSYDIHIIKGGENFDIIRVEAVGAEISPVYMIGKP